jgi:stage II sporulation protein D (peptidoglycan lytic transglycosylase)
VGRVRARTTVALALALLTVAFPVFPSSGTGDARAATPTPGELIRFVAAPGSSIAVYGEYPHAKSRCVRSVRPVLHARYSGTLEVGRDASGKLFVIGVLPVEDYLEGIAEVPRLWPMEALKAQVVAARSYALAHLGHPGPEGEELGYQLCATDACQVYRGLGISDGPYGDRWRRAVEATAGQVLLYGGRPADTLYSSTSNGHTIGNDQVFGSDPLPYLRPVPERDDGASPLAHWRASIPFSDLARFLRTAGDWPKRRRISSVALSGGTVTVRGGGAVRRLTVAEFRSDVNSWAHCLAPDRYPTLDTDGRLPQTVPSVWFNLSTSGRSLVLRGRGWGHGVGMVQWGAYGKAARGLTYRQILGYYYGGLRPRHLDQAGAIRVGIAVGLDSLTLERTGMVTVEGAAAPPGPWLLKAGQGELEVRTGTPVEPAISPGAIVRSPSRAQAGRRIKVLLSVPQTSVVHLALATEEGEVSFGPTRTYVEGSAGITGRLPRIASGAYRLVAVVSNGIDVVRTPARRITLVGTSPSPTSSPTRSSPSAAPSPASPGPGTGNGWEVPLGTGVIVLAILAGGLLAARARRRRRVAGR